MNKAPSVGPDPAKTTPMDELPRFRAEHLVALLVGLVVLGLAALFVARPAYREFKRWRAVRMIAEVPALSEGTENDRLEAGRRVRVALGLAPQDPQVLRTTAQFSTRLGLAAGLTYWRLLSDTGHATREDRLATAKLAIPLGQLDVASSALESVLKADPSDAEAVRLKTQLLLGQGRTAEALASSKRAFELAPDDAEAELTMAQLEVGSRMPAVRADGRRRILKLAATGGPQQEAAVTQIVYSMPLTNPEAENLLRAIGTGTNRSVRLQLQSATIRIELTPDDKAAIIRATIGTHLASTNLAVRAEVTDWAMREGGAAELLDALPTKLQEMDALTLSVRLEAAALLGRWEEFDRVAAGAGDHVPAVQMHSLNALRLARSKKDSAAVGELTEALNTAGKNPRALAIVAVMAEGIGSTNLAVSAWRRLLDHPTRSLHAARQILRLSVSQDDFQPVRAALERLHQLNPDDRGVARRLAYLNLLLAVHIPEAKAIFQMLEEDAKEPAIARLGLAFAQWRAGDAIGALAIAERGELSFESLPQHWRAVYVALLGAADRRAAAREFARKIEMSRLRPVERALVEQWL